MTDQETSVLNPDQLAVAAASKVDKLEENDLLRLLLVNRDIDLYDSQMTILKLRMKDAQLAMTALNQQMRDKYGLKDTDTIDSNTGVITRNGKIMGTP